MGSFHPKWHILVRAARPMLSDLLAEAPYRRCSLVDDADAASVASSAKFFGLCQGKRLDLSLWAPAIEVCGHGARARRTRSSGRRAKTSIVDPHTSNAHRCLALHGHDGDALSA